MGSEAKKEKIKILQVSNISVSATRDQIFTLLQYIGKVDELRVYPSDTFITSSTTHKVAFVKFDDERSVEVGQHLTNTVLIDRALTCVPWVHATIPDEATFINSGGSAMAGQRQLPPHVINKKQVDADGNSLLITVDPTLEQLGLPTYPTLPGDTDASKIEEIRRTVYVGNLPKGLEGQSVLDFFNSYIGEVMYLRMAVGPETLPCSYCFVEFSQQSSVPVALQNSGIEFQGRPLKITHSRVAIIKPQQKTADQALEEVEEAIRMEKTGSKRSRTRSPRRRRSPSPKRDRSRRSRSRRRSKSKERRRTRSRSKDRKRSRSRDRRRSRSRDRKSRRSRSRDRKDRSKSRDRKRSRSRDRKRDRDRDRDRERDRKERRRSRSRSRDRKRTKDRHSSPDTRKKEKDGKENDKAARMDTDDEEALREKLLEKAAARNGATESSDSMDVDEQKVAVDHDNNSDN